jgi:nucleoside 2-deoxyribosyltransferase
MPSVYLAGAIAGLTYEDAIDWRRDVEKALTFDDFYIEVLSPMRYTEYLKGQVIGVTPYLHPLSTDDGITIRDRFDVKRCDIVLVNLLDAKTVSIGTCIELGWASAYDKPVILVMETESNLHDHAMVRSIGKIRVDTLAEGIELVQAILCPSGMCTNYND